MGTHDGRRAPEDANIVREPATLPVADAEIIDANPAPQGVPPETAAVDAGNGPEDALKETAVSPEDDTAPAAPKPPAEVPKPETTPSGPAPADATAPAPEHKAAASAKVAASAKPAAPSLDALHALYDTDDFSGVVRACSTTTVTAVIANICMLAACHTHDIAKVQRWLSLAPAGSHDKLEARCKDFGSTI
jgi:hypothetical protein